MKRLFPNLNDAVRSSVLMRTALVMGLLALLSLASIVISALVADDISGRANAVNVSGSLRFLSFRTLSEVLQPDKRAQAPETMKVFEHRLLNLERFVLAKSRPGAPSEQAVSAVLARWNTQIRNLELAAAQGDPSALKQVAIEIPHYVDQIDRVVYLIEIELEDKARLLRVVQLGLLAAIVLISMLTIWMLHRQLVQPLAQLVQAAKTVAHGSFAARVKHVSNDELGQLGRAFNTMVEEIASMYSHLEEKVEEKTRELTRTNQSLELLYRVSQQLSASDLSLEKVQAVMHEVEEKLELGHSMICISESGQLPAHRITSDLSSEEVQALCGGTDCAQCFASAGVALDQQARDRGMIAVPIGDGDRFRGVLPILIRSDVALSRETARIIETVGHHVSNAPLNLRRTEEKHRMAVLEERTVIARELHDSIAQSLSYLQIQVTRLRKSLEQGGDTAAIADELKQGLSGAYRELRELISTFRLRIDERGFHFALQETIAEFSAKLGFSVRLNNALSGIVLSGNEEMHVIRIIREALSNIERHAEAHAASVDIVVDAVHSVTVRVADDGKGFDQAKTPSGHFGVNIMHDRAQILDGRFEVESAPRAGTVVTLQFLPQRVRQAAPELA
jgi:two-component system nitrate/nitrite sensor histidine kinase NarX